MEKVNIKPPFIKLGQFLKLVDIIQSGGEEKIFLSQNEVYINNELDVRRGRKLYAGDIVKVKNKEFEVTCE